MARVQSDVEKFPLNFYRNLNVELFTDRGLVHREIEISRD